MEIFVLIIEVLIAALSALLIFKKWEYGIAFIFAWWLIGDSVRKIIPGSPPEIILVGDFILAVTYISFLFYLLINKKSLWKPPFLGALLAYCAYTIIGAFNPNSFDFLTGAVGLRSYLWYLPLIFVAYEFFGNRDRVVSFLEKISYSTLILFPAAIIRFIFPSSGISLFAPFQSARQVHSFGLAGTGNVLKIPSLFGTGQRFGMVALFLFLISIGLYYYFIINKRKKRTLFFLILSILSFINIILSASRSAFMLSIIGFLIFIYLLNRYGRKYDAFGIFKNIFRRRSKLIILVAAGLLILFLLGFNVGLFQLTSVYDAFNERIPEFFRGAITTIENIPFFGYGVGVFTQGLEYVDSAGIAEEIPQEIRYATGETGFKRTFFELGIIGGMIFFWFWIKLFLSLKFGPVNETNADLKILFVSVALFPFLSLIRYTFIHQQVLSDYAVLIPLWFSIGLLFKLPELK